MGEKKVVSRRVFLGIMVLCIVPLIILSGVLQVQNANIQSQASSKNSTIAALNSKINSMSGEIANLQDQISSENASNTKIQNQLNSETDKNPSQTASNQATLASDQSTISQDQVTISEDQEVVSSLKTEVSNLESQISLLNQNSIGNAFSIVQITDTQYLSDLYPAAFDGLTSWIVANGKALNLAMVVHTGDIVETPNNVTDWKAANNAMMTLYNNEVPYCWDAGNHDQIGNDTVSDGNVNGTYIGGNYPAFNATNMRQESYWVGDIYHGASTAVRFSYGNYHFMIINVEYDANQTTLNWMQSLIESNPNVNVIVATHNFLNGNGTYGTKNAYDIKWGTNFAKLLNNYPNVFMTLNGHDFDYGPAGNMRVGNREEIFFNRQELDNHMGAATARIYTFNFNNAADPVVDVYTYQTFAPAHFLTDPTNQFTFSPNLTAYSPLNATIPSGTDFLGASAYSVSFATSATLQSFTQYGDTLTFNGLTMNAVTSNFTVTSVGANIVINSFPSNTGVISYTVSGSGGSQMFSVPTATSQVSVEFNGASAPPSDWSYSPNVITETSATSFSTGEVTVTGAPPSATVTITLT